MSEPFHPDLEQRDFVNESFRTRQEADALVADIGGLPEITRAATDVYDAIEQTQREIMDAAFADRFSTTVQSDFDDRARLAQISPFMRIAADAEGEQGLKREQLLSKLQGVEYDFARVLQHLVSLRADLVFSQQNFEGSVESTEPSTQD